jgi:hypothetical protein
MFVEIRTRFQQSCGMKLGRGGTGKNRSLAALAPVRVWWNQVDLKIINKFLGIPGFGFKIPVGTPFFFFMLPMLWPVTFLFLVGLLHSADLVESSHSSVESVSS